MEMDYMIGIHKKRKEIAIPEHLSGVDVLNVYFSLVQNIFQPDLNVSNYYMID